MYLTNVLFFNIIKNYDDYFSSRLSLEGKSRISEIIDNYYSDYICNKEKKEKKKKQAT